MKVTIEDILKIEYPDYARLKQKKMLAEADVASFQALFENKEYDMLRHYISHTPQVKPLLQSAANCIKYLIEKNSDRLEREVVNFEALGYALTMRTKVFFIQSPRWLSFLQEKNSGQVFRDIFGKMISTNTLDEDVDAMVKQCKDKDIGALYQVALVYNNEFLRLQKGVKNSFFKTADNYKSMIAQHVLPKRLVQQMDLFNKLFNLSQQEAIKFKVSPLLDVDPNLASTTFAYDMALGVLAQSMHPEAQFYALKKTAHYCSSNLRSLNEVNSKRDIFHRLLFHAHPDAANRFISDLLKNSPENKQLFQMLYDDYRFLSSIEFQAELYCSTTEKISIASKARPVLGECIERLLQNPGASIKDEVRSAYIKMTSQPDFSRLVKENNPYIKDFLADVSHRFDTPKYTQSPSRFKPLKDFKDKLLEMKSQNNKDTTPESKAEYEVKIVK